MNTSLFIGLILFGFGLLVFSMKLMAYNRKKYNLDDSDSELPLSKEISRSTFRLLAIVILIIMIVILYLQPQ